MTLADPARRRATYDDVLAAPSHVVAEIVGGELVLSPRPSPPHARAATVLGGSLSGPFDRGVGGPGGWWILFEPELHPRGVREPLVPDIAGWKLDRMSDLPDGAAFELAPDWICEVLSPKTAALDRARKMPIYADIGVGHAWLVDPLVRTLEVYRLEAGRWSLLSTDEGDRVVRREPFDAVDLDLAPVWGRPARK